MAGRYLSASYCAIEKPDVVSVMAPTFFSVPSGLAAARLMSAKAWLHVFDLEVDAAFELGFIRNARLIGWSRAVERRLMRRFDLVSTISTKMREKIERKGVDAARMVLFPNWVDTHKFSPQPRPVPLRRELGIADERCVALYSGSMGRKQGLEHVIEAARLLAADAAGSPMLLLAGAGPMRAELERSAHDLPNVRFLPLQPAERLNQFLNVADIHLLPQRRDASDLVMPSKLLAMLATGRPVIATAPADSEIARMLVDTGIITPPEMPGALAAAIRELARDPARRQAMGAAAAAFARISLHAETILREAEARIVALADREGLEHVPRDTGAVDADPVRSRGPDARP